MDVRYFDMTLDGITVEIAVIGAIEIFPQGGCQMLVAKTGVIHYLGMEIKSLYFDTLISK